MQAKYLSSYRNFRENRSAFTLFNSVPLKQYFVEEEEDEIQDLEGDLKEEHSVLINGKYYQNESFNEIWRPNPNTFQGKSYLLISPFVASAGSLFAKATEIQSLSGRKAWEDTMDIQDIPLSPINCLTQNYC